MGQSGVVNQPLKTQRDVRQFPVAAVSVGCRKYSSSSSSPSPPSLFTPSLPYSLPREEKQEVEPIVKPARSLGAVVARTLLRASNYLHLSLSSLPAAFYSDFEFFTRIGDDKNKKEYQHSNSLTHKRKSQDNNSILPSHLVACPLNPPSP